MTTNLVKVCDAIDPAYTKRLVIQARPVNAESFHHTIRIPNNFRHLESYRGDLDAQQKTGLWSSAQRLLLEYSGETLPPFAFPCFCRTPGVDWGDAVEWIVGAVAGELECLVDEDDLVGWDELHVAFEKFNAAQRSPNGLICWREDFTRVVVLDEARFEAFLAE